MRARSLARRPLTRIPSIMLHSFTTTAVLLSLLVSLVRGAAQYCVCDTGRIYASVGEEVSCSPPPPPGCVVTTGTLGLKLILRCLLPPSPLLPSPSQQIITNYDISSTQECASYCTQTPTCNLFAL